MMSQFFIVSKTKFQHFVTTTGTFFFKGFSNKALSLRPFYNDLMKLKLLAVFFIFGANDEHRTTNQPEISCLS